MSYVCVTLPLWKSTVLHIYLFCCFQLLLLDLESIFLSIPPSPPFLMNDSDDFEPEASGKMRELHSSGDLRRKKAFFPVFLFLYFFIKSQERVVFWGVFLGLKARLQLKVQCLLLLSCLLHLSITPPSSADAALQQEQSPSEAEAQQSREISPSSSSSPWDSPDDPFQALRPTTERAQSAPITLPSEPVDPIRSQTASNPPKSVDAFSSLCWSQSQWFAFSDNFAPTPHRASAKDVNRPQSGSGRSNRFFSDGSSGFDGKMEGGKEDSAPCFSDVFTGIPDKAATAASPSKLSSGKNERNRFFWLGLLVESVQYVFCLFCSCLFLFVALWSHACFVTSFRIYFCN